MEGFKETLAKASGIELRLRELVSDAGMMKNQMHVSTYVSSLSMLQLLHPRAVLIDFQGEHFLVYPVGVACVRAAHSSDEKCLVIFHWGHFLVHPVGVAPKAPSNFLKLVGVLCCRGLFLFTFRWEHFLVRPVGVVPKFPSNFLKLLGVLCIWRLIVVKLLLILGGLQAWLCLCEAPKGA